MLAPSRSLLAAVLVSLSAVACAAPTEEAGAPAPPTEPEAAAFVPAGSELAARLSATAGVTSPMGLRAPSEVAGNDALATGAVIATLKLGTGEAYDVLGIDFGVEAGDATSLATGGAMVAKAKLLPVRLSLRARGTARPLAAMQLGGKAIPELVVELPAVYPTKAARFATFTFATVVGATTTAGEGGTVESVELQVESALVEKDGVIAALGKAGATCSSECGCANTQTLGGFTQTKNTSTPIALGTIRVESLDVAVATPVSLDRMEVGKTTLERHVMTGLLDRSGICAMGKAATGALADKLVVDVSSPLAASLAKPLTETRFEACLSTVRRIRFASSPSGIKQEISTGAGGLVRSDFTYDAMGKQTGKSVAGFSFVKNAAIASCGEVL